MIVFSKDSLRSSVEAATGGKVTVLYDNMGYPSYMVIIPKFKLEDIESSGDIGTGIHPAFSVNGVAKSQIFIGQYLAIVNNSRACSLPGVAPTNSITFDSAKAACVDKGAGWHLMTRHEWSAVMLWCLANGFQPGGNTNNGRNYDIKWEVGLRLDEGVPGDSGDAKTLTGSGPASWRHDKSYAGISDLVGNVREWQDLMKINNGRIYMPSDNYYNLADANWPALDAYFDSHFANTCGEPILSSERLIYKSSETYYDQINPWSDLEIKAGWTPPQILKTLGIAPAIDGNAISPIAIYQNVLGGFSVRNMGERFPMSGGDYGSNNYGGLASLNLTPSRSLAIYQCGLRPAFIA